MCRIGAAIRLPISKIYITIFAVIIFGYSAQQGHAGKTLPKTKRERHHLSVLDILLQYLLSNLAEVQLPLRRLSIGKNEYVGYLSQIERRIEGRFDVGPILELSEIYEKVGRFDIAGGGRHHGIRERADLCIEG